MVSGYTIAQDNVLLARLAPVVSPVFSGIPAGPTAAAGTNTTQLATTAFVANAISGLGGTGGGTSSDATTTTNGVIRLAGDLSGTAAAPTVPNKANLNSPAFTGTPTAPTAAPDNKTTQIATTAYVQAELSASPALGGTPTAATATFGTNTTQLATTAFVQNAVVAVRATKLIADGSYSLGVGDDGNVIEMGSANANSVTIPTNASVPFSIGVVVEIFQAGAGATTILAASGVTLRTPTGGATIQGQWGTATLRKRGTNEWVLAGLVGA
jgi:hypothetical protein